MRTRSLPVVAILLALAGCQTGSVSSTGSAAATHNEATCVGQPALAVVHAATGREVHFFDAAGREVPQLPAGQGGSVSIVNADQSGQDNYAFNSAGIVTRHLRSYGINYGTGVWLEIK